MNVNDQFAGRKVPGGKRASPLAGKPLFLIQVEAASTAEFLVQAGSEEEALERFTALANSSKYLLTGNDVRSIHVTVSDLVLRNSSGIVRLPKGAVESGRFDSRF